MDSEFQGFPTQINVAVITDRMLDTKIQWVRYNVVCVSVKCMVLKLAKYVVERSSIYQKWSIRLTPEQTYLSDTRRNLGMTKTREPNSKRRGVGGAP